MTPSGVRIPRRIESLPRSATVDIADTVAAMRENGDPVLDFSAGRAAEHTPAFICAAASAAMDRGVTHQTPARGAPAFLEACATKLARDHGLEVDPARQVLATLGCKQGLLLSLMAVLDPGDEVLVEDPAFVSYRPEISLCGGTSRAVALNPAQGFRWDEQTLEAAVGPRTRAILMCSPHNPTGTVHTTADLDVVAAVARRHDLVVIVDATYERLVWGERPFVSLATRPGMADRTIGLVGLTKPYSMGGWRIGFLHGPPRLVDAMVTIQGHLQTCAGSFTQWAAATVLAEPARPEISALWQDWEARCNHVADAVDDLPGLRCTRPEGGFYAWIDARAVTEDDEALARVLLAENGVALVPGSAFGSAGRGYLRMTCVRSWDDIESGLSELRRRFK